MCATLPVIAVPPSAGRRWRAKGTGTEETETQKFWKGSGSAVSVSGFGGIGQNL